LHYFFTREAHIPCGWTPFDTFFFDIFVENAGNSSIVGGIDVTFAAVFVRFTGGKEPFRKSFEKELDGVSAPQD